MEITELLPDVLLSVDGLPDAVGTRYVRNAIRQFSRDTGVWNVLLGTRMIDSPPVDEDLVIAIPSPDHDAWATETEYDVGDGVERAGENYVANREHTSTDAGANGPPGAADSTAWDVEERFTVPANGKIYEIGKVELDGDPIRFPYHYSIEEGELTIEPSPVEVTRNAIRREGGAVVMGGVLSVRANLQPTHTAMEVPDLYADWETAITSRALYEILAIPDKSWSNAQASSRFRRRYRQQVGEAKGSLARGHTTRPIRTRHRAFI